MCTDLLDGHQVSIKKETNEKKVSIFFSHFLTSCLTTCGSILKFISIHKNDGCGTAYGKTMRLS